jgi:hypothetical protein
MIFTHQILLVRGQLVLLGDATLQFSDRIGMTAGERVICEVT